MHYLHCLRPLSLLTLLISSDRQISGHKVVLLAKGNVIGK